MPPSRSCFRFASVLLLTSLLAACGGGSGSGSAIVPVAPAAAVLTEIGALPPADTVLATECASPEAAGGPAAAALARYPRSAGSFRGWAAGGADLPTDYATPMQLRGDRAGGYIVSHRTDAGGAMFRIAATGEKSALPVPYAAILDVAADGRIWYVRDGALSVATRDGALRTLAALGDGAPTVDGPLGTSPLGPVGLIAAGRDTVYLLVESGSTDWTATPPSSTVARSLRVLNRSAPGQDLWTLRTVALAADIGPLDVVSAMRVGPTDELVLLLNQPFRRLVSQTEVWPGSFASVHEAAASVRVFDPVAGWRTLATRTFELTRTPTTSGWTARYALDARDLGISPAGVVTVGGAGGLWSVDAVRGWMPVAASAGLPVDAIGRDGPVTTAGFANAAQVVPDSTGLAFYDGESCQVRRLEGGRLATISGPRLAEPGFAGAGLLGMDAAGEMLFAWGDAAGAAAFARGRYAALYGLGRARLDDPSFLPRGVRSLAAAVGEPSCIATTSYRAQATGCTGKAAASDAVPGHWLGATPAGLLARRGADFRTGLDTGAGQLVGSTLNWPGVLNGDAPSGPSGMHLDGNALHVFGWVRTDPPVVPTSVYHELRLYRLDLGSGAASVVAGATIDSAVFAGRRVSLSAVIPEAGGGPALVQRRPDGGYWLSNGKELWLLDIQGQLRRIAGLATSGGGLDGSGSTASFGSIASIRVLADNRLLVVDQGAHAVRLASDDGRVLTLVGQLNQAGQLPGPLPARLDSPVDVWPVGRDLYITTTGSRRLLKANNAL